jgi:Lrp/AsnC family leucine-responsive transcriptional regulator
VTGSDALVIKVMAASIEHLETLIDRLSAHGPLTTSIVLSTPVTRRIITQMVGDLEDVEVSA